MRYILLALLCSCAMTQKAQTRRYAETNLKRCLYNLGPNSIFLAERQMCIKESAAFCQAVGLENTCGTDGVTVDILSGRFRY
jgi:hypothetical protein